MLTLLNIAFVVNIPKDILGKNVLTISPSSLISKRSRPPLVGALRPHLPLDVVTPFQDGIVLIHFLFFTS